MNGSESQQGLAGDGPRAPRCTRRAAQVYTNPAVQVHADPTAQVHAEPAAQVHADPTAQVHADPAVPGSRPKSSSPSPASLIQPGADT